MALTVKTRMYINLAILATALVVVGGIGLTTLNRAARQMHSLYAENLVPIHQIDEVFQRSLQSQQYRLEAYVHRDPAFTQANYDAIKANRARINELLKEIDGVHFGKEEQALSDQIRAQRASLVSIGKEEIDALLSGDYAAATRIRLEQIEPIIDSMDASTQRLTDLRRARAHDMIVSVEGDMARDRWIIIASFVASLGLALVFAWRLTRYVTDGLIKASECATRVSTGELGKSVDSTTQDEIGDVLRALHRMDGALLKIAQSLTHSAHEVDSAARRFSEGSDDLSERTQQQAAALEETAASMEEMAATIKHTTDNTSLANQLVANTKARADESGTVLNRTVEAMEAISASSRQIEDIIGVIDEIAFQTNLLALNAAVEAARAGEQGRGFAVVAGEVRNLAQRSASAAKEIKSLITDSVEKVSAGSSLVSNSGEKLSAIVADVKQVADLVHEMSAAAQEQSAGINQINQAVSNMDGATQQNAALVEESSAAAKLLQQQAQELHALVAFFRFTNSDTAVHRTIASASSASHESVSVKALSDPRERAAA